MADDDVKVRLVQNPDRTVSVEGQKSKYTQTIIRSIHLTLAEPRLWVSYDRHDENQPAGKSVGFLGEARLTKDRLGRIGVDDYVRTLPMRLCRARPAESAWTGVIGFIPYQSEFSDPAAYFVELQIPDDAFEEMLAMHQLGSLKDLLVILKTDLWGFDHDYYEPPSGSVSWHLPPGADGSIAFCGIGNAKVSVLRWSEKEVSLPNEDPSEQASEAPGPLAIPPPIAQQKGGTSATDLAPLVRKVSRALWAIAFAIVLATWAILATSGR